MPRTACRIATVLAATAAVAVSLAGSASADEVNVFCHTVHSTHLSQPYPTTTREFAFCVPWPL